MRMLQASYGSRTIAGSQFKRAWAHYSRCERLCGHDLHPQRILSLLQHCAQRLEYQGWFQLGQLGVGAPQQPPVPTRDCWGAGMFSAGYGGWASGRTGWDWLEGNLSLGREASCVTGCPKAVQSPSLLRQPGLTLLGATSSTRYLPTSLIWIILWQRSPLNLDHAHF